MKKKKPKDSKFLDRWIAKVNFEALKRNKDPLSRYTYGPKNNDVIN